MHSSHHKVVALKAFSTLLGVNSLAGKLLVICMQENAKEGRMEKQEWCLNCGRLLSFVTPGQN